ncbi:MAG: phenylalanine--tRNA ligase subunit beta [Actinobacteria bacterium]|nr:phenylalanine--tRNA ligase subunit beta [Actinomycetota bacterium]MBT7013587.1 phenylalanine--tRNA ligase subunit beta [Actinomycetota bacterium]
MKVLKSWLSDWVDIDKINGDELSLALESLGFEIESRIDIKPNYKNIVVGKVLEIYPHPNADKVRVTKVDTGNNVFEIVCGAFNFDVGAVVPVALPKSEIRDSFLIDKRDIRGVESNGMICSATELDLWEDNSGILLLDEDVKPGTDFSTIYPQNDIVWEIGVTPNRGDCMSHLGVARELSHYFKKPLLDNSSQLNPSIESILSLSSGTIKACNTYAGIEIENIKIKDSNFNTKYRLSQVGTRIINNVVDYTNYVLYDIGQPLHAFDRDKLFGKISVRYAKQDETLLTLDNQNRQLSKNDLIITADDKPIALAGVMGGLETEVTQETNNLLIESAYFDKVSIMNTSRKLNLISDASIRFERGIDHQFQLLGLNRFINIFQQDQHITYSSPVVDSKQQFSMVDVSFSRNEIYKILGIKLENDFIENMLEYLGINYTLTDTDIVFQSPSWRYDLERPIDLIEEFAKHYGFNNFESTLPIGNNKNNLGEYWHLKRSLTDKLIAMNMYEIQTLSFVSQEINQIFTPEKKSVEINNPIDQTNKFLRTSLHPSLIEVYKNNLEQNNQSEMFFEINNVFDAGEHQNFDSIPNQIYSLSALIPSKLTNSDMRQDPTINDIYFAKQILIDCFGKIELKQIHKPGFHQNLSFIILKNNKVLGHLGQLASQLEKFYELNNSIFLLSIDLSSISSEDLININYSPLSPYPYVKFDLSFMVPDAFAASELIQEVEKSLINNENVITIFDDFKNEKSRNLGIRINTRSYSKTYSEEEVTDILNQVVDVLENKFSIKLNKGN